MNDDYLWDRSGPPDPEIEQLERTLAPLRYRPRPELAPAPRPAPRFWMAAAAAVFVAAMVLWRTAAPSQPLTGWRVAGAESPVRTGQLFRTGDSSGLRLVANDVGQVEVGSDSELRAATSTKLQLNRGSLHAFIWARPGQFVVDTPSARATDLGCMYDLTVDSSGNGLLRVTVGWVAFHHAGRESFIPAGAACVTRRRLGPGIPYYEDSSDVFRSALTKFESGQRDHLGTILAAARSRDALTLWHLLARVSPHDRGAVFDRFAQLISLPPEVSRDGAVHLDAKTMDRSWDALNLENTQWWRGWEQKWPE